MPDQRVDPVLSAQARDEAMEQVDAAADAAWKAWARQFVIWAAENFETFTTDDLWANGLTKPREPRAIGPILAALAREGRIERVATVTTAQVSRHAGLTSVWRLKE